MVHLCNDAQRCALPHLSSFKQPSLLPQEISGKKKKSLVQNAGKAPTARCPQEEGSSRTLGDVSSRFHPC